VGDHGAPPPRADATLLAAAALPTLHASDAG
jgi:hypothetical protein